MLEKIIHVHIEEGGSVLRQLAQHQHGSKVPALIALDLQPLERLLDLELDELHGERSPRTGQVAQSLGGHGQHHWVAVRGALLEQDAKGIGELQENKKAKQTRSQRGGNPKSAVFPETTSAPLDPSQSTSCLINACGRVRFCFCFCACV